MKASKPQRLSSSLLIPLLFVHFLGNSDVWVVVHSAFPENCNFFLTLDWLILLHPESLCFPRDAPTPSFNLTTNYNSCETDPSRRVRDERHCVIPTEWCLLPRVSVFVSLFLLDSLLFSLEFVSTQTETENPARHMCFMSLRITDGKGHNRAFPDPLSVLFHWKDITMPWTSHTRKSPFPLIFSGRTEQHVVLLKQSRWRDEGELRTWVKQDYWPENGNTDSSLIPFFGE